MGQGKIPTIETCRDLRAAPIVVTARGVVLDGHVRLEAAREIGIDEVRAVVVKHPDLRANLREEC